MKERNSTFFLNDILFSIDKILRYTNGLAFDDFKSDEKTIDAVERNFEIIGEAVKNLSLDLTSKYPNIPFRQVAGMRDKLIHDYFGTDYEIVYKTIKDKLPEFKEQIKAMLNDINEK